MTCRILIVTTDSKICGTESMILTLLKHLHREPYQPYLVTLMGPGDLIQAAKEYGIDGQNLGLTRRQLVQGFFSFHKIIKTVKPDIIHSFLIHSNLYARATKFFHRNLSVISGIRTVYTVKDYGKLYGWVERLSHPLDNFYVANSQHGLQSVIDHIGLPKEKLLMIHNGLDLENFESFDPTPSRESIRKEVRFEFAIKDQALVMGIVAQLRPPKRHDLLLLALAKLKDRYPLLHLLIVGQGQIQTDLKNLAVNKGIENRVVFTGYRADVSRILHGMDIFALPSVVEGLPVSIMEAMYAELPVVAARVGGIPEVVSAGESGLLCEPGNLDDLCQALIRLIESPELRIKMGAAGKERIRSQFSAEHMARRFESLYDRCMKNR